MELELEQAWSDLQATPSYVERVIETPVVEFRERNFCLSCGQWDVEEGHECQSQEAVA